MGNEPGREVDPNAEPKGKKDKTSKKNADKPEKSTPSKDGNVKKKDPKDGGFLKNIDTSKLKHPPTDPIEDHYIVSDKVLGMGNFSVVKLGTSKATGERVAIKVVDKSLVKNKPEMLTNEVDILLKVDHPNIVGLKDLFDTPDKLLLVMELVTGGELFDKIVEREQFNENEARYVMKQLFDSIAYLHSLGIVHRDLKPENLLLASEKNDTIKLADFGLSKIYTEEMMLSTACGTPGYVAPEILECEGYDQQIDMWSSGVIMYILLCGYPPFYNENDARLFDSILAGQYEFHSPYWDHISDEAKDLIRNLLLVDPQKRLTAVQASNHVWFSSPKTLPPQDLKMHNSFHSELAKHNSIRKQSMAVVKQNGSDNTSTANLVEDKKKKKEKK